MATLSKAPMFSTKVGLDNQNSFERQCENKDCNVNKLLNMVMRCKTPEFVTQPYVLDKPLLVNGFTTIFQVDGYATRTSDIKHKDPNGKTVIYRIKPNTHAHIVNYVVIDEGSDSMRKINCGDPTTMRTLLESQRLSADQMLKKLMSGKGTKFEVKTAPASGYMTKVQMQRKPVAGEKNVTETVSAPEPVKIATSTNINDTFSKMNKATVIKLPLRQFTLSKQDPKRTVTTSAINLGTPITTTLTMAATNQKLVNLRLGKQLQVKSLTPGTIENKTVAETTPNTTNTVNNMGKVKRTFIKTVPLSQLQQPINVPITSLKAANFAVRTSLPLEIHKTNSSLLTTTSPPANTSSSATSTPAPSKEPSRDETKVDNEESKFARMQKELADLRRTVSILAEATKKKLEQSDSELASEEADCKPAKRPREK